MKHIESEYKLGIVHVYQKARAFDPTSPMFFPKGTRRPQPLRHSNLIEKLLVIVIVVYH